MGKVVFVDIKSTRSRGKWIWGNANDDRAIESQTVNIVRDVISAMHNDSHLVAARASNIHEKAVRALD